MNDNNTPNTEHKRRVRYKGTHPRKFSENIKNTIQRNMQTL